MLGWKLISSMAVAAIGTLMSVAGISSGPEKGEALNAFEPTHVTGADKGTQTCPVCKYGNLPAVQVWVNEPPAPEHMKIAAKLEAEMARFNASNLRLKTFMIFRGNAEIEKRIAKLATDARIRQVAMTYLDPSSETYREYKINPEAKTTVLVYRNRRVSDKFIDMAVSPEALAQLQASIEKIEK